MQMRFYIPKRYAPIVYGIIQAAMTSAVATTVSLSQSPGGTALSPAHWLSCWTSSLLATLPLVILIAPIIQRIVLALTEPSD